MDEFDNFSMSFHYVSARHDRVAINLDDDLDAEDVNDNRIEARPADEAGGNEMEQNVGDFGGSDTMSNQGNNSDNDDNIRPSTSILYSVLFDFVNSDEFFKGFVEGLGGSYRASNHRPFINFLISVIECSHGSPKFTRIMLNIIKFLSKRKAIHMDLFGPYDIWKNLSRTTIELLEFPETMLDGYEMVEYIYMHLPKAQYLQKIIFTLRDIIGYLVARTNLLSDYLEPLYYLMKCSEKIGPEYPMQYMLDPEVLPAFIERIGRNKDYNFVLGGCLLTCQIMLSDEFLPKSHQFYENRKVFDFVYSEYMRILKYCFNNIFDCISYMRGNMIHLNTAILEPLTSKRNRFKFLGKNIVHATFLLFREFVCQVKFLQDVIDDKHPDFPYLDCECYEIFCMDFLLKSAKFLFNYPGYRFQFDRNRSAGFDPTFVSSRNIYSYEATYVPFSSSVDNARIDQEIYNYFTKTYADDLSFLSRLEINTMEDNFSDENEYSFETYSDVFQLGNILDVISYSKFSKVEILKIIPAVCLIFTHPKFEKDQALAAEFEVLLDRVLTLVYERYKMQLLTELIKFIAGFLHHKSKPRCLFLFWIKVLRSADPPIIGLLISTLGETFRSIFPKKDPADQPLLRECVDALLICENTLAFQVKYRGYISFLNNVRAVSSYFPPNDVKKFIFKLFVRLMSNKVVLPSKHALIRCGYIFYLEHFAEEDYNALSMGLEPSKPAMIDIFNLQLINYLKDENHKIRQIGLHSILIFLHVFFEAHPESEMFKFFQETRKSYGNIQITDLSEDAPNLKLFYSDAQEKNEFFEDADRCTRYVVLFLLELDIFAKLMKIIVTDIVKTVRSNVYTLLNIVLHVFKFYPCEESKEELAKFVTQYSTIIESQYTTEKDIIVFDQMTKVLRTIPTVFERSDDPDYVEIYSLVDNVVRAVAFDAEMEEEDREADEETENGDDASIMDVANNNSLVDSDDTNEDNNDHTNFHESDQDSDGDMKIRNSSGTKPGSSSNKNLKIHQVTPFKTPFSPKQIKHEHSKSNILFRGDEDDKEKKEK